AAAIRTACMEVRRLRRAAVHENSFRVPSPELYSAPMEIIIEPDAGALAERAAQVVFGKLAKKPDLVLGLATGRTPVGLYERLRKQPDAFSRVRFFNLD